MRKWNYLVQTIVVVALFSATSFGQVTYTVNQTSGGDFSDLAACMAAIDAGSPETVYTVNFTDASAVTYTASWTVRNGVQLTMGHASADIVTIDAGSGMIQVSNAGGTFAATNLEFIGSGWAILHGYDGQSYTNCAFGPNNDNGIVIRGGTNSFVDCTFANIPNGSVVATGGTTTLDNCTWTDCGRVISAGDDWNAGGLITINGGSATMNHVNSYAFVMSGNNVVVNDFTTTGFRAVYQRDWEVSSTTNDSSFVANNCSFTGLYDRAIAAYINQPMVSTATFNNCLIEGRADASSDIVVIDGRGNGDHVTITLNGCTIRYLNSTGGTCAAAFIGGTLNLNNCVIDGAANGVLVSTEGSSDSAVANVNHCVFVNNTGQAADAGNHTGTSLTIQNSIVDVSCAGGINASATDAVVLIENNMTNVSGTNDGSPFYVGDPMFIDVDYHIDPASDCAGKGVVTALVTDIDGDTRPTGGALPDIGLDEVDESTIVRQWSLY